MSSALPLIMAADSGTRRAAFAAQVCLTCKSRKKKCDKLLPGCGYCGRKGLRCRYVRRAPSPAHKSKLAEAHCNRNSANVILTDIPSSEFHLFVRVQGLIRDTGQYVDGISVCYFEGLHQYLPFISRSHFEDSLMFSGVSPPAELSVLLLSMCLVTSTPKLGKRISHSLSGKPIDLESLYLVTKSLLAQVQSHYPCSLRLVQSKLLVSVYEYADGRPDQAFATLAGCARLAYAARLHQCQPQASLRSVGPISTIHANYQTTDRHGESQEIFNTWWALVICERSIFCEVTVDEQPLVTLMPKDDSDLPVEIRCGNWSDVKTQCSVSSLSVNNIEGFGRVAQATWLVNKVLMAFKVSNTTSRLTQLRDLDATSQGFLAQLLQQHPGSGGIMCEAISITLRMLFKLHDHMLHQIPNDCNDDESVLETWRMQSRAALRAATKMVVEIAQAHENASSSAFSFFTIAPSYSYILRVGIKNLHQQVEEGKCDWLKSAEGRLRSELGRFET
ncbi:transcription factor gsfR2 [Colletotrichum asianum]|uniref:Transcription factor gsfR2 n=1 Tax=Colletotrichum asianum TaxID=702518 RepID=A0A8H3ZPM2_9PEZI|nr:transcription factor gsfR2 [Colletotrichum asianum]